MSVLVFDIEAKKPYNTQLKEIKQPLFPGRVGRISGTEALVQFT